MKYTKEQIQDNFDKLPKEVQDAIVSNDTFKNLQSIGQKYQLHIDQAGELGSETGLLMMGLTPPSQFADNLVERLRIGKDTASQITTDVNIQILQPLKEHLMSLTSTENQEEGLTKDDILNEIENPTSTPSIAVNPNPIYPTEPIVPSIAEQKLTTITHKPTENVVDPYREPIN